MISHRFRQRRFDADEEAVGKVIRVNEVPTTIVGVLPPGYTGIRRPDAAAADVHLPLATLPLPERDDRLADGTAWWLPIMGRLKPGATAVQVQGNLDGVLRAAAQSALASHLDGLSEEERALPRNRNRSAEPRLLVDSGQRGLFDANPRSSGQALVLASSSPSSFSSCAPTWPPCCCRGPCRVIARWRSACRSALRGGG